MFLNLLATDLGEEGSRIEWATRMLHHLCQKGAEGLSKLTWVILNRQLLTQLNRKRGQLKTKDCGWKNYWRWS